MKPQNQQDQGVAGDRVSRRGVLSGGMGGLLALGGLAVLGGAGGCVSSGSAGRSGRPGAVWPGGRTVTDSSGMPVPAGQPVSRGRPVVVPPPAQPTVTAAPKPAVVPVTPPQGRGVSGLTMLPRSAWTRQGPTLTEINPMQKVERITVHHEGWNAVYFTDRPSTAARLEQIRKVHTRDRGWSDIGYHFIVDRSGTVWQGRELKYQGAHVRDQNERNIGILVLGNFDKQSPSREQTASLVGLLKRLQSAYRVPTARVRTHQEYNATSCPGKVLQAQMAAIRKRFLA
ncbi:MAG: peptidoglycan recognition family protein [Planctomycetota bacterium]